MDIQYYIKYRKLIPEPANFTGWAKVFEQLSWHTRKLTPEKLFKTRRPNEEAQIHKYREENFEPITYGSINKAFDTLYRIFAGLKLIINGSKLLKEHIEKKIFGGFLNMTAELLTFKSYLEKLVLKRDIEDPNGLVIIIPTQITDESKSVVPLPVMIYSYQINYFDDELLVINSIEKSEVRIQEGNSSKKELTGNIFWIFDRVAFYKLVQIGKKADDTYRLDIIYTHNIGQIPYVILGGDINSSGYYESFFEPAIAYFNLALGTFSDWQGVFMKCGHPYIEELTPKCNYKGIDSGKGACSPCESGYVTLKTPTSNDVKKQPCPQCNGSGRMSASTPFGTFNRAVPNVNMDKEQFDNALGLLGIPSRKYIEANPAILTNYFETWQKFIELGEENLHLNYMKAAQSGYSKEFDREEKICMIVKISNNFYDNIVYGICYFMDAYLNPSSTININIVKPTSFELKTEDDFIAELSLAYEKGLPAIFINKICSDLAKKKFNGDPVYTKVVNLILTYSKMSFVKNDTLLTMLEKGGITQDEYTKALYFEQVLSLIIEEVKDEAFLNMSDDTLMLKVNENLKNYSPIQKNR
jgi:hypothetical protein